jgi:hypothetical protein
MSYFTPNLAAGILGKNDFCKAVEGFGLITPGAIAMIPA